MFAQVEHGVHCESRANSRRHAACSDHSTEYRDPICEKAECHMAKSARHELSWTIGRNALTCAFALAAIGCGQPVTRVDSLDAETADASAADTGACELVPTPGGLLGKSCVHEVPDGALVDIDDAGVTTVSLDGKGVATYPPCTCPHGNIGIPGPVAAASSGASH
jgi:hypothetical protein